MKEFIEIFEYIYTQINYGDYYNPFQHSDEENFAMSGKNPNDYVFSEKVNGKAKFIGFDKNEMKGVFVFSYENNFTFKLSMNVLFCCMGGILKGLGIKKTDFRPEQQVNESVKKVVTRIKKVLPKSSVSRHEQVIHVFPDIGKAVATDSYIFVSSDIKTSEPKYHGLNPKDFSVETDGLNDKPIRNVFSLTYDKAIRFESSVLKATLKAARIDGVCIAKINDMFYLNIENLQKILQFIPKKEKYIELMYSSFSIVSIINEAGDHLGLCKLNKIKDTDSFIELIGEEVSVSFVSDYREKEQAEPIESAEPESEIEAIESAETIDQAIEPDQNKQGRSEPSGDEIKSNIDKPSTYIVGSGHLISAYCLQNRCALKLLFYSTKQSINPDCDIGLIDTS